MCRQLRVALIFRSGSRNGGELGEWRPRRWPWRGRGELRSRERPNLQPARQHKGPDVTGCCVQVEPPANANAEQQHWAADPELEDPPSPIKRICPRKPPNAPVLPSIDGNDVDKGGILQSRPGSLRLLHPKCPARRRPHPDAVEPEPEAFFDTVVPIPSSGERPRASSPLFLRSRSNEY